MTNPLNKLYRNKNVYISLPSNGKYYYDGIKLSVDGELGVMPMTIKDEIMLKSPDALFNGEALISFIKSCVPDITNPEEIPICDLDLIIMGVRAASNKFMEMECTCPKCNKKENYDIDITKIMATAQKINENNKVELETNNVIINCRPYSLRSQLKTNIQKFHSSRLELLLNDKKIGNKEKSEMFDQILADATKITIELIVDNIVSVSIDGEIIEEKSYIREWVENMEKSTYSLIKQKIEELSENKMNKTTKVKCIQCENEYEALVELNPLSFFI